MDGNLTLTAGTGPQRAAGARSGAGNLLLDAAYPWRGLVGDVLARESKGQRPAGRAVDHGDGGRTEFLGAVDYPADRMIGGIPKRDTCKRLGALPGYAGHIDGKVAENVHGGTFRAENERTQRTIAARDMRRATSAPGYVRTLSVPSHSQIQEQFVQQQRRHGATRGLDGVAMNVAPHLPGCMTAIPGKVSENVHGVTPAEASHQAQHLRRFNPHVSAEAWIRKGTWPSDRRPTYKFLNRFGAADTQQLYSRAQDEDYIQCNRTLGHTFGLNPPRHGRHKPGDRYIHSLCEGDLESFKKKRVQPHMLPPAGTPTHSVLLDGERWKLHNALALGNGNQRNAAGGAATSRHKVDG